MEIRRIEEETRGKTVIITGGTKGIGKGCAHAFCLYGANVVIVGRDEEAGKAVCEWLNSTTEGRCEFYKCSVSDAEEMKKMVEWTVAKFGKLDCIVNNAGYLARRRPIDQISGEDLMDIVDVNVKGCFLGCKYALPYIRKTKGSIINMSSVLAHAGQEGSCIYTATKGAIVSMTKSLAADEARNGVRVNVVLPGDIKSELNNNEKENTACRTGLKAPEGCKVQWIPRSGEAEEIGTVCVFLSSSWAGYMTGAEINVDGAFQVSNGFKIPSFDWSEVYDKV